MNHVAALVCSFLALIAVGSVACGGGGGARAAGGGGSVSASSSAHAGSASSGSGGDAVTIGSSSGSGGACSPACPSGLTCVNGVCQGVIDFETIPGGAPMDGLAIGAQFEAVYGVSFGLDVDLDGQPDPGVLPVLAMVGNPETAFNNDGLGVGDTAAPGQNVGMFFLTDDGKVAGPPAPLVITYASPVNAAYGEIIDIDGMEGWTVEARDGGGAVIDSVVINAGDPGAGDGIATPFSFQRGSADIHSIRLRYTGAATGAVGLAFDNFSPASATLPPAK